MLEGLADSAGRAQSVGTSQDLPTERPRSTLVLPGALGGRGDWRSRTGETTPPRGLRPGRGPLATSTRPSGLQRCFPSGVTMLPELLCSTQPPRPKPQPDPGQGAGVPCSQSRAAWPPGQGAGLAAGASLGWRPQGEWVPRLPPGEEVGLWAGEEVASDRKAHWARAGWE